MRPYRKLFSYLCSSLILPVAHGYTVEIDLALNDTYTVRRVFTRAGKRFVKATVTGVYFDQIGEVAYQASCYHDPMPQTTHP